MNTCIMSDSVNATSHQWYQDERLHFEGVANEDVLSTYVSSCVCAAGKRSRWDGTILLLG